MHKDAKHLYGLAVTEKLQCMFEHFHNGMMLKFGIETQIDPEKGLAVGVVSEHGKETRNKSNNLFFLLYIEKVDFRKN